MLDAFTGNPDPSKLYLWVREYAPEGIPAVPTGRCVYCGVLCSWPELAVHGDLQTPTLVGITDETMRVESPEPAVVSCNCPRCDHRWRVVGGNVEDAR